MSFNRPLRTVPFARDPAAIPDIRADRSMRLDRDEIVGRIEGGGAPARGGSAPLSRKLDARLGLKRKFGLRQKPPNARGLAFDPRQRAIVKIHYFSHGGGGAAALMAHIRYIEREAASRGDAAPEIGAEADAPDPETAESRARAHAAFLARDDESRMASYDACDDRISGTARAAEWAKADRRHFRLIIAPENGAVIGDLKPYVRDVMARAEAALGVRLEWIAADHWDTDNPHTHVVLRGRSDGRDLIIPRAFVQHGFRNAARDAATERLGWRGPEDERLALEREARAHRPTRLDALIAQQVPDSGRVRVSKLEAPNGDSELTNALKARARELKRLGLARDVGRNMFTFVPDWRECLVAMELHLDVRKRIVNERTVQRSVEQRRVLERTVRGLLGR